MIDFRPLKAGEVGTGEYRRDGKPCCAGGWAVSMNLTPTDNLALLHSSKFNKNYVQIACVFNERFDKFDNLESINDRLNADSRALLFNATAASLGHIENNEPEAVKLAIKAGFVLPDALELV